MRRSVKIAAICIMTVVAVVFFVFAPVVPMSESLGSLYVSDGRCPGGFELPAVTFYSSGSYAIFGQGVVYIPHPDYLWWLPQPQNTSTCPLVA